MAEIAQFVNLNLTYETAMAENGGDTFVTPVNIMIDSEGAFGEIEATWGNLGRVVIDAIAYKDTQPLPYNSIREQFNLAVEEAELPFIVTGLSLISEIARPVTTDRVDTFIQGQARVRLTLVANRPLLTVSDGTTR